MKNVVLKNGVEDSSLQNISNLLEAVGLRNRNIEELRLAIRNSSEVVCAFRESELIGFGRLISDGVYYGTIWDVAVSPHFQRQGVGKMIVGSLIESARSQNIYMLGLFTAINNREFYEHFGFTFVETVHGMICVKT